MITIKVGGKPLYIPKDTTLVLEQNNNSFDIDNITSDIIWTFDVPGKPNAKILESANYINISSFKEYPCEILAEGFIIGRGKLYIQTVTDEDKISCGVVLDGLTPEFGKRKLKENDYGADVQISPTNVNIAQHQQNWINFLQGSLNSNSIYKFFLFACEKFYKNNEDWGFHNNHWATLDSTNNENKWAKFVNRVFMTTIDHNTLAYTGESSYDGIKLFNVFNNETHKENGFAFAPAIRLDWLVKKVFANAGYQVLGDFFSNPYVQHLYVQSMNAMDGTTSQFDVAPEYVKVDNAIGDDGVGQYANKIDIGVGAYTYRAFRFEYGYSAQIFKFQLNADTSDYEHNTISPTQAKPWTREEDVLVLLIRSESAVIDGVYPKWRAVRRSDVSSPRDFTYGTDLAHTNAPMNKYVTYDNNRFSYYDVGAAERYTENNFVTPDSRVYCIQLTPSNGNPYASFPSPSEISDIQGQFYAYQFWAQANYGTKYIVELARFKAKSVQHGDWDGSDSSITATMTIPVGGGQYQVKYIRIQKYGQLEELSYAETLAKSDIIHTNNTRNVFDRMLRWKEHVPNITNSDFIKSLCKFFGVSLYVDTFAKTVQLSLAKNLFNAGSVDITEYITNSERMAFKPKKYSIGIDTVMKSRDIPAENILPSVGTYRDLPDAWYNKKKVCYVENENVYYISTKNDKNKKYEWVVNSGNNQRLEIGEGEEEAINLDIKVPNMMTINKDDTNPQYICDIEANGNSKVFDDDYTGEFDLIIQQYQYPDYMITTGGTNYVIERATPMGMSQLTADYIYEDNIKLCAEGYKSLGEEFLKQHYEFLSKSENFRFTAQLPMSIFWKVYQMQLPQTGGATEPRWIMVKNRKYIPTKISYEFGEGDKVLTTIECARRHYE